MTVAIGLAALLDDVAALAKLAAASARVPPKQP